MEGDYRTQLSETYRNLQLFNDHFDRDKIERLSSPLALLKYVAKASCMFFKNGKQEKDEADALRSKKSL